MYSYPHPQWPGQPGYPVGGPPPQHAQTAAGWATPQQQQPWPPQTFVQPAVAPEPSAGPAQQAPPVVQQPQTRLGPYAPSAYAHTAARPAPLPTVAFTGPTQAPQLHPLHAYGQPTTGQPLPASALAQIARLSQPGAYLLVQPQPAPQPAAVAYHPPYPHVHQATQYAPLQPATQYQPAQQAVPPAAPHPQPHQPLQQAPPPVVPQPQPQQAPPPAALQPQLQPPAAGSSTHDTITAAPPQPRQQGNVFANMAPQVQRQAPRAHSPAIELLDSPSPLRPQSPLSSSCTCHSIVSIHSSSDGSEHIQQAAPMAGGSTADQPPPLQTGQALAVAAGGGPQPQRLELPASPRPDPAASGWGTDAARVAGRHAAIQAHTGSQGRVDMAPAHADRQPQEQQAQQTQERFRAEAEREPARPGQDLAPPRSPHASAGRSSPVPQGPHRSRGAQHAPRSPEQARHDGSGRMAEHRTRSRSPEHGRARHAPPSPLRGRPHDPPSSHHGGPHAPPSPLRRPLPAPPSPHHGERGWAPPPGSPQGPPHGVHFHTDNSTVICCPACPERKPFCAVFYGEWRHALASIASAKTI